jgi:hypothetical protein
MARSELDGSGATLATRASAPALVWFSRLIWLGIVANIVVALIAIAWPSAVLAFLHLEPAQPLVWPRFAAFLLILLSIFYVPAAIDPVRNRFAATFAVICRFGGVFFFALIGGYILFRLFDLVFGLPQVILLWLRRQRS